MYTKRIFEQVRDLIEADARDKKPGEAIDSEIGYAKRFGVSRPTARKAVEELIRIGMIRRVPGKGLVIATQDDLPYRGKLLIALPYEVGDGFLFKVILGCVEQANLLGFDYKIIGTSDLSDRLECIKKENLSGYVAAITSCYEDMIEYSIIDIFQKEKLPYILMDNPSKRGDSPCVTCDDFNGGYQMGAYLAKKGHRNIINLSSSRPVLTIERRDAGFVKALQDAGIKYDTKLILNKEVSYMQELSTAYNRRTYYTNEFDQRFSPADILSGKITAICSHTSLAIVDISRWLVQHNIHIYDDISLMGYGDHPYLPMLNIPCTIIDVPSYEMGKSAIDEISAALIENRPIQDVQHEVWLEKRRTVKTLQDKTTELI